MVTDPLSRVFAALADPTRRDMVARLAVGDATVEPARRAVRRDAAGGLQAPAGARGRRPGEPAAGTRSAGRCHLEAEVFDLMTKWIERYRPPGRGALPPPRRRPGRDAEQQRRRPTTHEKEPHHDHDQPRPPRPPSRPTRRCPIIRITRDSRPRPSSCSAPTPSPTCSRSGSGPRPLGMRIDHWDAAPAAAGGTAPPSTASEVTAFHGCFHEVRPDRIVQTFTYEGMPGRRRAWRR